MSKITSLVVSQPEPSIVEKSPFFDLAKKYHLTINYTPFIRVEGVSAKEFRSQHVEILEHSAIIFTSRTTVDNFFRICEETRTAVPETMKYLCQTEAIALYLQKYIIYRKRKISFADGTFTGLMELVLKHKGENFLLTLSEPHKPEIPATLEKLKVKFDRVILARTVSSDLSELQISRYQVVVLYSPPEVKALTEQFPGVTGMADGEPLIATFGEGTTRAAIAKGLKVSAMAPTPEAPSMARALDIFIGEMNSGKAVRDVVVGSDRQAKQAEEFVKAHQTRELKRASRMAAAPKK